jgi:hypothetical protein
MIRLTYMQQSPPCMFHAFDLQRRASCKGGEIFQGHDVGPYSWLVPFTLSLSSIGFCKVVRCAANSWLLLLLASLLQTGREQIHVAEKTQPHSIQQCGTGCASSGLSCTMWNTKQIGFQDVHRISCALYDYTYRCW